MAFLFVKYGEKETEYLKSKDKVLGAAIDKIGHIYRPANSDMFSSVVDSIIGQQISSSAHKTIIKRMTDSLGSINVNSICSSSLNDLQAFGTTFKKAEYIKNFAQKVDSGDLDLNALYFLSDEEVIRALSQLHGIGIWTAEMIMTFCMQRPNIISFGDLAILRGMRMLYHHKKIDKKLFDKYKRRYSPYATIASLYLWAIAGGAIPEMKDFATKKGNVKNDRRRKDISLEKPR